MPDKDANKNYVDRYVTVAKTTTNDNIKTDALYRAGTQMEVIPCNGNADLTQEQQQAVLKAASELLNG
jgi:hypothetical protein